MKPAALRALLLSPVVILLFTGMRLLLISNYNTTTAGTIATSGGFVSTLLGTILPLLPVFLPAAILFAVAVQSLRLAIVLAIITLILSPAFGHLGLAVPAAWREISSFIGAITHFNFSQIYENHVFLVLIALTIWSITAQSFPGSALKAGEAGDAIFGFIFALFWFTFITIGAYGAVSSLYYLPDTSDQYTSALRKPWLPIENIGLTSGEVVVGYVVSTKDDWTIILQENDRLTRYVKPNTINARKACRTPEDQLFRAPIWQLSNPPAYIPLCRAVPLPKR